MIFQLFKNLPFRNALIVSVSYLIVVLVSYIPGIRGIDLYQSLSESDQSTYITTAINLIEHGTFSRETIAPFLWEPYRTPGLPLLISLSLLLTRTFLLTPILICFIAGFAAYKGSQLLQELNFEKNVVIVFGFLFAMLPNTLGLSCFLLTDALFAYLNLIWFYYLYIGFTRRSITHLAFSTFVLAFAQLIKPTLSVAWILLLIFSIVFAFKNKFYLKGLVMVILCSLIVPTFLSVKNYKDHGVYSSSLLGEATIREYLIPNYLANKTSGDYYTMQKLIRAEDQLDAGKITSNQSMYGKLNVIQKHKNDSIIKNDPLSIVYICSREFIKQIIAPQEFLFQVFIRKVPNWLRGVGFFINLIFLALIFLGIRICIKLKRVKIILLLFVLAGFYLSAGTLSSRQGARLRLPVDVLFLPIAAVGLSSIKFNKNA